LGTPLNVASARAELIASADLPRTDVVQSARTIVEQTDRMTDIVRQLLDFSRRRGAQRAPIDVRHIVTRTADLIRSIAAKARVSIACSVGSAPALVAADHNQIQQALLNLIMNGIQAMPHGGRLRLTVDLKQAHLPTDVATETGDYWCITVEDEGTGIPPEYRERLFEPFFTTKRIGEGTGLGLPVARDIVTEHGGWIEVESAASRGTRFLILLPPAPADARRIAAA
jgi:signal transduction histidine kinase